MLERDFGGEMPFLSPHTNQLELGNWCWNWETSSAVVEFPPHSIPHKTKYKLKSASHDSLKKSTLSPAGDFPPDTTSLTRPKAQTLGLANLAAV